jgi:iron complex outermembrane receptor protein
VKEYFCTPLTATMKIKLSLLFPFLFGFNFCIAQQSELIIDVTTAKKEPLSYATAILKDRFDSSKTNTKQTDEKGRVVFSSLSPGQYLLRISAVNHEPIEKGLIIKNASEQYSFTLEPAGKTLETVVVESKRPLMRQEDDKTIIDPEPLAASSTSGYEVIEKTPGLFVDQDGNIYISSLTPAAIQINGREMKMSAADIATLLKSLPPTAISRIEIVRQPSAKYDASGSGGVVNVVLKKGVKLGMTGSVNGGIQQGDYGNQFIGFNLNNNTGDKTSFINLNVSRRNTFERIKTDRIFAPDSMLSQDARTLYSSTNYFGSFGYAWKPGQKWEADYGASMSLNDFRNSTDNPTQIRKISTNSAGNNIENTALNAGYTLNIRNGITLTRRIDSADSEWKNDLFHNYTRNESDQSYSAEEKFSPIFQPTGGSGSLDNHRHYLAFTSDLRLKLPGKFVFETGLKSGILWFKSRTEYFQLRNNGELAKDPERTNSFDYRENINALYLQGSKTLGKDFVAKFGIRAENTNMEGHQLIPRDTTFDVNRTDLFPYIYLSKNIMKIFGYDLRAYLIYRRTINRPVYEQLNPFPRYVDQFLSEAGNPSLRPQFTSNYEANVSVDERPILAAGINETQDIFTNVIYPADTSQGQNRRTLRTYDNLGKNTEWYLRGLAAIPPGGKYFIVIVSQYNHNFYRGLYENKPLSFKKGTWTFFMYQSLKLGKLSQFTMHGFLRLKGQQQFYELGTFGALNASINRQFFKQKLVVTLSMNDIFYTQRFPFTINQGSIRATGERFNDSRRVGINLRYNFGIRKKEETGPDLNNLPMN